MVAIVKPNDIWEIQLELPPDFYPIEDDEPVAETSDGEGAYQPIGDNCSRVLGLRLQVEGYLIGFYRLDTGEKLLNLNEISLGLQLEHIG